MARQLFWLTQQAASDHHLLHYYGHYFPAISFFAIAGGLIMSVCCVTLIVSMCTLYKRRQVDDKASSSDGDSASPSAGTRAKSRQGFCLKTSRKVSAQRLMKQSEEEKEGLNNSNIEVEQQQQQQQQQGKLSPHVWQRAILMGERCQRPTFSGLVLYDDKGNPLPMARRLPPAAATPKPS